MKSLIFITGVILIVEVVNFAFNYVLRRDLKKIDAQLESKINANERVRRAAGIGIAK